MQEKRIKSLRLPEPDNLVPRARGDRTQAPPELLAGSSGLGEVSARDASVGDGEGCTHPVVRAWGLPPPHSLQQSGQARVQDHEKTTEARDSWEQHLGGPGVGQASTCTDAGSGSRRTRCGARSGCPRLAPRLALQTRFSHRPPPAPCSCSGCPGPPGTPPWLPLSALAVPTLRLPTFQAPFCPSSLIPEACFLQGPPGHHIHQLSP